MTSSSLLKPQSEIVVSSRFVPSTISSLIQPTNSSSGDRGRNTMKKIIVIVAASFALTGCGVIDPLVGGSEMATVVAVNLEKGCSVTFTLKGDSGQFVSVPSTPRKRDRCNDLRPGQMVPVATDPLIGDYPYVLFESIEG